jgi:prepilin-type N-terminal cleavage/methylation domain-containing protein
MLHPLRRQTGRSGFTLVEMLVVVGLILLLISILVPTISGIRKRGYDVRTRALMQKIASACQVYVTDWHTYPGPLPEGQLYPNASGITATSSGNTANITSSENLVLGLLGGLATANQYNSALHVGPLNLNPFNPKQNRAYIDYNPVEITQPGKYPDMTTKDSDIPEFVDGWPDPKPILYLRARAGSPAVIDDAPSDPLSSGDPNRCQYHTSDVVVYSGPPVNVDDPSRRYDAVGFAVGNSKFYQSWYDLFRNDSLSPIDNNGNAAPNSTEVAKGKDTFLLIGAGLSRIWVGRDCITLSN